MKKLFEESDLSGLLVSTTPTNANGTVMSMLYHKIPELTSRKSGT